MAFIIGEVTAFGRNLMAQATATNKIVYTHAIAESVARTRDEIRNAQSIPAASGIRISGVILSSSATGNVARISTQFTNQSATRYAVTIWLYGRLESQSSANVVAAIVSDSNIYIPANTLAETKIVIDFNIAMQNGSAAVQITEASAATVGQLRDLEEKSFGQGNLAKRRLIKQYANWLEAQCYAQDGEDFTLQRQQSTFTIRFEAPNGLENYESSSIKSICDHWLLMLVSYTRAPEYVSYIFAFDLRKAALAAIDSEIRLGSPDFYGKLPSSFGHFELLKAENDYFVTCLSGDVQWLNESLGQNQSQVFTSKNAVMPLQNSHNGQVNYTAGFFYPASNEITLRGCGKYAIFIESDASAYIGQLSVRKSGLASQGLFAIPADQGQYVGLGSQLFLSELHDEYDLGGLEFCAANDTRDGGMAFWMIIAQQASRHIRGGVARLNPKGTTAVQEIGSRYDFQDFAGFSRDTKSLYPHLALDDSLQPWWNEHYDSFNLAQGRHPFITPSKDGLNLAVSEAEEFALHAYESCLIEHKPYSIPALSEHTFTLANTALPLRSTYEEEPAIAWLGFKGWPYRSYVVGNSLVFSPIREKTKNHFVYHVKQELYRKTNGKI